MITIPNDMVAWSLAMTTSRHYSVRDTSEGLLEREPSVSAVTGKLGHHHHRHGHAVRTCLLATPKSRIHIHRRSCILFTISPRAFRSMPQIHWE